MTIGFVFAIPPGLFFEGVMQPLGLAWELRGRESFMDQNNALWIYCFVFYVVFIYVIRSAWSYLRSRRAKRLVANSEQAPTR